MSTFTLLHPHSHLTALHHMPKQSTHFRGNRSDLSQLYFVPFMLNSAWIPFLLHAASYTWIQSFNPLCAVFQPQRLFDWLPPVWGEERKQGCDSFCCYWGLNIQSKKHNPQPQRCLKGEDLATLRTNPCFLRELNSKISKTSQPVFHSDKVADKNHTSSVKKHLPLKCVTFKLCCDLRKKPRVSICVSQIWLWELFSALLWLSWRTPDQI